VFTRRGPTVCAGSLDLLASYQEADGESGTNVPHRCAGTFPETGYNYSASYSMTSGQHRHVLLYTGDLSFVRAQWPMIMRELAYDSSLWTAAGCWSPIRRRHGLGLLHGSKTGEVSAYNDIYFETSRARDHGQGSD